ncbi:hypothetical protein AVEN_156542-1 [Araneus ventricosus]|uniref:RNase H type-1 domain-containing protein n=1 Tax=Araneus ventricosus TaxID=182803 RepID=A0A4Y2PCY5_ARAVE|nr:hypothetical protein AVEN_156542-1 [Araneus ventricosus]
MLRQGGVFLVITHQLPEIMSSQWKPSKFQHSVLRYYSVFKVEFCNDEWMAQLSPFNTVFQAELLAIQEACLWASKTNQQIKVWSDSESSLHSIDTKSPIAQQTQEILLGNPKSRAWGLFCFPGWVGSVVNVQTTQLPNHSLTRSAIAVMKRRTY